MKCAEPHRGAVHRQLKLYAGFDNFFIFITVLSEIVPHFTVSNAATTKDAVTPTLTDFLGNAADRCIQGQGGGAAPLTVSGWFSKISLASSLLHSSSMHSLSRLPFLLSSNKELALLCRIRNWEAVFWLRTGGYTDIWPCTDLWIYWIKLNLHCHWYFF